MDTPPPIDNWILGPATQLDKLVKEAAYLGTISKSLILAAGFRPFLELAKAHFLANQRDVASIDAALAVQDSIEMGVDLLLDKKTGQVPTVLKHSVIGLWAFVEGAIDDTLVAVLKRSTRGVALAAQAGLRVFHGRGDCVLDEDEARDAVRILRQKCYEKGDLNSASIVPRLLGQLGIPFKTSESEQADLVELCAVRNCLVHLAGRVDDRIEKAIPKLGIDSGETIELTENLWKRWYETAGKFQEALMYSSARSDYANWWDPVLGEIIPGPGLDDALERREKALREGVKIQ